LKPENAKTIGVFSNSMGMFIVLRAFYKFTTLSRNFESHFTFRSLPFKKAKEYLLNEGDILFARIGAMVGRIFQFK